MQSWGLLTSALAGTARTVDVQSSSDANVMLLSRDRQTVTVTVEGMEADEGTALVFTCFVNYAE